MRLGARVSSSDDIVLKENVSSSGNTITRSWFRLGSHLFRPVTIMASDTVIHPKIFKEISPPIPVSCVHENALYTDPTVLSHLLATAEDGAIGLAPVYGSECVLATLAVSTPSQVLVIRLGANKARRQGKKCGKRATAQSSITGLLCNPEITKYAFRMDRLSTSLFFDFGLRITNGVDLLSISPQKENRRSFQALMVALGGQNVLKRAAVAAAFKHDEGPHTSQNEVALQAWAALHAAKLPSSMKIISNLSKIDTETFDEEASPCFLVLSSRS